MDYFIYKIECLVNKKVYIGQTKHLKKRWREHKNDLKNNRHRSTLLQRAWIKYGESEFIHEVIEVCSIYNVDEREVFWINYFDSTNKYKGFNTEGGGNANKIVSDETKKKQSAVKSGKNNPMYQRTLSEETLIKKSIAMSGENNPMYGKKPKDWMSEKTYKKWVSDKIKRVTGEGNPNFGKPVPEERKLRYSEMFAGEGNPFFNKKHTDKTKSLISKANSGANNGIAKKVLCVSTGIIFDTVTEASKTYNVDGSSISKCCRGKLRIAGKLKDGTELIWKYVD